MSKQQGTAKTFTDLIVWKKAHQFVLDVYSITKEFPQSEIYGLAQQLRRSAVSIAANIAEGFKKRSIPDKARFMNIAQGSLEESRYYLILINDLPIYFILTHYWYYSTPSNKVRNVSL